MDTTIQVSHKNASGKVIMLMVSPALREYAIQENHRLQRETFAALQQLYDKVDLANRAPLPFHSETDRTSLLKEAHAVFIASWAAYRKFVEEIPTELVVRATDPVTGESTDTVTTTDLEGLASEYTQRGMAVPTVLQRMLKSPPYQKK